MVVLEVINDEYKKIQDFKQKLIDENILDNLTI